MRSLGGGFRFRWRTLIFQDMMRRHGVVSSLAGISNGSPGYSTNEIGILSVGMTMSRSFGVAILDTLMLSGGYGGSSTLLP